MPCLAVGSSSLFRRLNFIFALPPLPPCSPSPTAALSPISLLVPGRPEFSLRFAGCAYATCSASCAEAFGNSPTQFHIADPAALAQAAQTQTHARAGGSVGNGNGKNAAGGAAAAVNAPPSSASGGVAPASALRFPAPRVLLVGPRASGKSALAPALCAALGVARHIVLSHEVGPCTRMHAHAHARTCACTHARAFWLCACSPFFCSPF